MTKNDESRPLSAVIGLVIAIVALLLSAVPIVNNFAFVLAVVSLVFGFVAMRATKKGKSNGRKMAISVVVLSLLAGVIVLASQSFYSKSLDEASKDVQKSVDTATGKNTDELLGKKVDVTLGTFTVNAAEYSSELPVKVTNLDSASKSYNIQIEAVDSSNARIAEDTVYANNLGSNQSQNFKAFQFVATDKYESMKAAKFKIVQVSQY